MCAHPGQSGIYPLVDGRDAFAARVWIIDAAERSIDVQYYIWHLDLSGSLLLEALLRAADRGVRVRLLLDDNNTVGLDPVLATLTQHPQIEVRLFNPFVFRAWRGFGYLTDFSRLNRRMHNKSLTADNQVTIIGGRNIGDEYFGSSEEFHFVDLDVLAIGPVVRDVSTDFDRYWTCDSSYPAERLLPSVTAVDAQQWRERLTATPTLPNAARFVKVLAQQTFVRDLLAHELAFEWTEVRMVSDDPAKGLGRAAKEALLPDRLRTALGTPQKEFQLISPYFVPTASGVRFLKNLARSGVAITVVTNSLEATDVAAVHAGYAKWRHTLLRAGIRLYEVKRAFSGPTVRDRGLVGNSGSSLHAKTFSVDGIRSFVGSFNFDPRSAQLNTEMGFVIESTALAQGIASYLEKGLLDQAYTVRKAKLGRLEWVETVGTELRIHKKEPNAKLWRRAVVTLTSLLPIEWLL